jgi:uncharacterized membrane protein YhiD involved in acid resistance
MTAADLLPFASSLAIGLLLGFERERSHRPEIEQAAGSRTFALFAGGGALATIAAASVMRHDPGAAARDANTATSTLEPSRSPTAIAAAAA